MTNKLPVVGKRYRNIISKSECLLVFISKEQKQCVIDLGREQGGLMIRWFDTFADDFEELPEDKAILPEPSNQINWEERKKDIEEYFSRKVITVTWGKEAETKPTIKENLQVELNPEVKEAMEELKKILIKESNSMFFTVHQSEHTTEILRLTCHAFSDKAKTLLNALDKQFKVNETSESVDIKEEEVNKISCGYNPLSDSKMIYLREEWGKNGEGFGAVLGKDMVGNLENKEEPNEKSEFELLMAGAEKIDKVDADIKKQTVDEFFSDYEKLKERVKKLEEK